MTAPTPGPHPPAGNHAPSATAGPTVPLPAFDAFGNLEAGPIDAGGAQNQIQFTTLADIRAQLVESIAGPSSRREIWEGWMRHRTAFEQFGIGYSTLVNGSFCTRKLNPGDIDVCYLLDADEVNSIPPAAKPDFKVLFDKVTSKALFRVDAHFIPWYPMTHFRFQTTLRGIAYWSRVFGTDRKGRCKCILMVGERGIL